MKTNFKDKFLKLALILSSLATLSWTSVSYVSTDLASEQGGSSRAAKRTTISYDVKNDATVTVVEKVRKKYGVTLAARAGNSGPKPDRALRARSTKTDESSDSNDSSESTDSDGSADSQTMTGYWTRYWEKQSQKTKDPIFLSGMQFQIRSLKQAEAYLGTSLVLPEPIDPNLLKIPHTESVAEEAFAANYGPAFGLSTFLESYASLLTSIAKTYAK